MSVNHQYRRTERERRLKPLLRKRGFFSNYQAAFAMDRGNLYLTKCDSRISLLFSSNRHRSTALSSSAARSKIQHLSPVYSQPESEVVNPPMWMTKDLNISIFQCHSKGCEDQLFRTLRSGVRHPSARTLVLFFQAFLTLRNRGDQELSHSATYILFVLVTSVSHARTK
jgi:hypothetical protein